MGILMAFLLSFTVSMAAAQPINYENPSVSADFLTAMQDSEKKQTEISEIRRLISADPQRSAFVSDRFLTRQDCPNWHQASEEERLNLASQILVEQLVEENEILQSQQATRNRQLLYPYFVRNPRFNPDFERNTPCNFNRPDITPMRQCYVDMMSRYLRAGINDNRERGTTAFNRTSNKGFFITTRRGTQANEAMKQRIRNLAGCTDAGASPSPTGGETPEAGGSSTGTN